MAVATALVFIWLGMVLAISFIETPLKFRAPGITRELGLSIGRLVFKALNATEVLLAVATIVALAIDRPGPSIWWPLAGASLIAVIQGSMLHTMMDRRAARIIAGEVLPPSRHHLVFVALEGVKVVLLIVTGVQLLRQLGS